MQIITEMQHQVLSFVDACNRHRYRPSPSEVLAWLDSPMPDEARYEIRQRSNPAEAVARQAGLSAAAFPGFVNWQRTIEATMGTSLQYQTSVLRMINRLARAMPTLPTTERVKVADAETAVAHLCRIGWLNEANQHEGARLDITPLGTALLREAEQDDSDVDDVTVVVLGHDDPLSYPVLIGQIARAGSGLLVDPYLHLEQANHLVVSTQIDRLLISGKKQQTAVRAAISTYLNSASLPRRVEVRGSSRSHDRVLITDAGEVYTLGTSLNGVGRTTTVFTPLPAAAAKALQEEYEGLWDEAELVGPTAATAPDHGEGSTDVAD